MILTVQIKLLPTKEQALSLRKTLEVSNKAANRLSKLAWEIKEFRQFPIHRLFYKQIRKEFPLSSQMVIRINSKVADAYKIGRDSMCKFRKHGSISYDIRILDFQLNASTVSIWSIDGRIKRLPFVCGDRERKLLDLPKGESDLIFRKGKWFLNVTIEVPEGKEIEAVDVLGVDMGVSEIAYDSDGQNYSGATLNKIRNRNRSLRTKLQRKGTKSARRLLNKRGRKEANFARNTNHIISKRIVQTAKRTNRAIAIEELTGIGVRTRAKKRKWATSHYWAFAQLGKFLTYKSLLAGVPIVRVDPCHTSQRCNRCGHTEKSNRKFGSFACKACGYTAHADENGASNIRLKGLEILAVAGAFNHPNAAAKAGCNLNPQ